jgi:hypothetical protein
MGATLPSFADNISATSGLTDEHLGNEDTLVLSDIEGWDKKDTGCKPPNKRWKSLSQTNTNLERTQEFSDTTDAIHFYCISDRRLRGFLVTFSRRKKQWKTLTVL